MSLLVNIRNYWHCSKATLLLKDIFSKLAHLGMFDGDPMKISRYLMYSFFAANQNSFKPYNLYNINYKILIATALSYGMRDFQKETSIKNSIIIVFCEITKQILNETHPYSLNNAESYLMLEINETIKNLS